MQEYRFQNLYSPDDSSKLILSDQGIHKRTNLQLVSLNQNYWMNFTYLRKFISCIQSGTFATLNANADSIWNGVILTTRAFCRSIFLGRLVAARVHKKIVVLQLLIYFVELVLRQFPLFVQSGQP